MFNPVVTTPYLLLRFTYLPATGKPSLDLSFWHHFQESNSALNAEEKRRRLTFYFISYVGGSFMLLFAINDFSSHNWPLLTMLFAGAILAFANAGLSNIYQHKPIFYYIAAVLDSLIVLGLTYSGGHQNTGLYWIFPLILIQVFIVGYKIGIVFVALTVAGMLYLIAHQADIPASYPPEHLSRFFAAFTAFIFTAFIGEYFWQRSHHELTKDNLEKLRQANTDPLTRLPNRRFLDSVYLERAMENPVDYFPLSAVVVDADHFKAINDQFGHDVGDNVLIYLTELMKNNIRQSDLVARTGGEEFLILYPKTSLSTAVKLAENIRQEIANKPFKQGDISLPLSASFGVATALTDTNINAALKLADENLYLAKQRGRNQVV
ncbi:GGDEF domain-containing protein [Bowmanella sp. JS7-9]|uniref:diguanylate cyclase n=2 Tax=Pseudobowmanella zhangzhouensis TaxID=1537679 RepID=A0ABW1XJH9_9ALTE|nr:GGDEF domain-containing protein [Bowmanella sp. JS7-9]